MNRREALTQDAESERGSIRIRIEWVVGTFRVVIQNINPEDYAPIYPRILFTKLFGTLAEHKRKQI